VRVLVADSLSKVRHALGVLVRQRPGLELAGEATDARDLLAKAGAITPDVVLLDWKLRGLPIDDVIPAVRKCCPEAFLIVLSDHPEARRSALRAGADAFVSKVDPPERLVAAIDLAKCRSDAGCPSGSGAEALPLPVSPGTH
jgi:DNA-binding NarL/FixJ family response regulator